jgi:hypothetical protein
MQTQGTALWRWLCRQRRELAAGAALVVVIVLFICLAPSLLAMAAIEWKHGRRRERLRSLALALLLLRALAWFWRDLRGVPHGRWHACMQCGAPIEEPSRARYCSHACRRYTRLARHAAGGDEQAAARLVRLRRLADIDPALNEIPF